MSNEELENMLENLENETLNQEGAQSLASSHELTPESEGKSSENLGARPKEFHNSHSRIFRCFFEQMCHLKKKVHSDKAIKGKVSSKKKILHRNPQL